MNKTNLKNLVILTIASLVVGFSTPAHALFVNGGFESGDLSGWTVEYGLNNNATPGDITWGAPDTSPYPKKG